MMIDVVPVLLEQIQNKYKSSTENSAVFKKVRKRIDKGIATYKDAYDYAVEAGRILARIYENYLTEDALPGGRMYYNIASRILEPTLTTAYEDVAAVCVEIQNLLNKKAGLGLKAVKPELNKSRISGLIDKVADADADVENIDER